MSEREPGVDDEGNIHVHGRGGIVVAYTQSDEDGQPEDISESLLFWEVNGIHREALGAGEDDYTRLITIDPENLTDLALDTPINFVLIDETDDVPDVLWSASLDVFGYRTEPPA